MTLSQKIPKKGSNRPLFKFEVGQRGQPLVQTGNVFDPTLKALASPRGALSKPWFIETYWGLLLVFLFRKPQVVLVFPRLAQVLLSKMIKCCRALAQIGTVRPRLGPQLIYPWSRQATSLLRRRHSCEAWQPTQLTQDVAENDKRFPVLPVQG